MPPSVPPSDVAPRWHTALLVALIVGVATTGTLLSWYQPASGVTDTLPKTRLLEYLSSIVVSWAILGYVTRVGRGRRHLGDLIGRAPRRLREVFVDVGLALVLWLVIEGGEIAAAALLGVHGGARTLLPETPVERAAWFALAANVGFCEEVIYRGYLRMALAGWFGSAWTGVFLQAILFGVAHADQGLRVALRIGAYGLLLGAVAQRRGSLVPGILAHVGIDLASGLG